MHPFLANCPVVIEQVVDWGDMDGFHHVNNVVYFRYFENARIEYLQRVQWMEDMKVTGIGPIVASTQARFRRAVFYPDTLVVGARIVSITEDRFTLEHLIVSKKSNEITTVGECVVVAYDYRNGKKVAIPEEIRQRIEQVEGKK